MSKSTVLLLAVVAVVGVVVVVAMKKAQAPKSSGWGVSLNLGTALDTVGGWFKGDKVTAPPANAYEVKGNELFAPGSNTPLEYGPF